MCVFYVILMGGVNYFPQGLYQFMCSPSACDRLMVQKEEDLAEGLRLLSR